MPPSRHPTPSSSASRNLDSSSLTMTSSALEQSWTAAAYPDRGAVPRKRSTRDQSRERAEATSANFGQQCLAMDNVYCPLSMAKLTKFPGRGDLSARRVVSVELPEFLLRAIEHRLAEANEEAARERSRHFQPILSNGSWPRVYPLPKWRFERDVPGISSGLSRAQRGISGAAAIQ